MDFLNSHFDALVTFLVTSLSFLGVMYKKFSVVESRISTLEAKTDVLEKNIQDSRNKVDKVESNLIARLDRIENKIDSFILKKA